MLNSLIVDDEQPVKIAITKLVDWEKYGLNAPLYASNGQEALDIMKTQRIDIVFLDMNMPIMNGAKFLELASKDYPECKYIVISGYDEFKYAKSALQFGACGYILKPIDENELNDTVAKAVDDYRKENGSDDLFSQTVSEEPVQLPPEKVVYIIKQYIDDNYNTNIHLSLFSEKYFYSREYLTKRFKSEFGIGIYEYLQEVRMKRAVELLNNPNMQVQEISDMLGFSDTNYFSKAFKKYYGMTPSAFRASS